MAGVPFELVEQLATPQTAAAARNLLIKQSAFELAKSKVEQLLLSRRHNLSKDQFRGWRRTIRLGVMPPPTEPSFGVFADCYASASELIKAEQQVDQFLHRELSKSRLRLLESASTILPRYLVFAGSGIRESVERHREENGGHLPRTKKMRARERHLLLYLQRVAAKNDTLSEFGPAGWGKVVATNGGERRVHLDPKPGIAGREVFLERWTAHAAAAAINADPEAKAKIEVPALETYAFEVLCNDVGKWPSGPARDKWLSILQPIAELPGRFAVAGSVTARAQTMDEANRRLADLGASRESTRFLYAATNPIGEECVRDCNFEIDQSLIDEVAVEAAPWIDLWRDNYAFIASRVATGLRVVMEKAGATHGVMPLPTFLQACEGARLPLTGPGLVTLAVMAFQEVKSAFQRRLQPHANLPEYELSPEDCHIIRDNFDYQNFDEYTYPSADLQLAATSTEAVTLGDYQWILAELHPAAALLQHGFYWGCPNKASLSQGLASTLFGKPNFHYGFFAADFTSTTTVRFFDALPGLTWFVAPQRANPKWQTVRPPEAEVYVDPSGDVCLRRSCDHEHLGSFARNWIIPLGFHPFSFSLGKHTPRLRCGKVIVQRRMWTIALDEIGKGDFTGVSRDLILTVERLRAARDLPRFIYIRPTEQALRRSGAEGRDKDTKPVFIDLESYLFLEIFFRWIVKAGEIEVTEMLPTPEDLFWKEADGRRTFELRTLIVPRA
jgi:hypothetical protein